MMVSALEKFGIQAVNPEIGDKLNPELHQAMTVQEDDSVEPNSILNVMQKGYTLNERLVRPAMVIVAKAPPQNSPDSPEENGGDDGEKIGGQIDEQA
jgi:molecular chaperone GrpE